MPADADILERPEPLTVPFWTSVAMHGLLLAALVVGGIVENRHRLLMGDPHGGGGVGVLVNPVASIPLPNRGGPENPVANDTASQVPAPPAEKEKAKALPKPKPPTADELLLKQMEKAPQRRPLNSQPNKFHDPATDSLSQIFSDTGRRMSSRDFGMQGGGGVRIGDNSPFGEQFGAYANIIRDNIARNWQPTVAARSAAPSVVVTFTIRRDGSVENLKIEKSSGIQAMDYSAQRAVQETKLPALPGNFPRNQADVELTFQVGK